MVSKTREIDVVTSIEDGCMLADNWHSFACGGCDHYHFELFDRRGERFAAMMVPPEDVRGLAHALLAHADDLEKQGILEPVVMN